VARLTDVRRRATLKRAAAGEPGGTALGREEVGEGFLGWLFVAPICLLIVVLVGFPLILSFQLSMQKVAINPGQASTFRGAANYSDLISASETMAAAIHTATYWIIAVTVELGIGLAAALALRRPFRGRGVILALLVLPWALPPVVAGLLWTRIFDPNSGWLNAVLLEAHVIDKYQVWFAMPNVTIPFIALVQAWGLVPLIALILLGGLQGIPSELYEAAQMDGASNRQSFRFITVPLLQPSLAAALAIGTVVSFGIFDIIYVLVGADRDGRSVMMQVYLTTFQNLDYGHGAALAVLISVVSGFVSLVYLAAFRKTSA
jgi:multiple sugar transport system permease protein